MASEYWCQQGLEITVEGPEGRYSVKVEKPYARIGRHGSSEYILPNKYAPHRGLYLHATDAGIYYVRLASSPSKNDKGAQGWLAPGQVLEVGPYKVSAQLTDPQVDINAPLPDFEGRSSAPPHPMMVVVHRGETIAHFALRRRLSVAGRDQHSSLRLADSQISTSHCILYREKGKLWAIDLLSSNGTFIGGQPIESALIEPGQSLSLGDHVELAYLSTPQTEEEDLDELTLNITNRLIQSDHQDRRRRRWIIGSIALLVLLILVAASLFLLVDYLADLREVTPYLRPKDN
jgi:hypothetical protein